MGGGGHDAWSHVCVELSLTLILGLGKDMAHGMMCVWGMIHQVMCV